MNLIVAVDKNWGIGCGGELLARIPEDMKYFRDKTLGKVVVMGRKTFESLPNGALPERRNIVLTRDKCFTANDVEICNSFERFLTNHIGINTDNFFIIGGETIYEQALPYCKYAYVTKINSEFPADRFMDNLDDEKYSNWIIESTRKEKTQSGIGIEFTKYVNNNVRMVGVPIVDFIKN